MNTSSVGDIFSAIGSLLLIILVIVLAYFTSRWYARRMGLSGAGKYIKLLDRTNLGNTSSLVIAQVAQKYYLIGISDKNMQLLSELPDFERYMEENGATAPAPVSFSQMLRGAMKKNTGQPGNKEDEGGGL